MIKSTLPPMRAETVRDPPRRKINSTSIPCFFQIPLSAATHDGAKPVASEGKPTRNSSVAKSPAARASIDPIRVRQKSFLSFIALPERPLGRVRQIGGSASKVFVL